MMETRPDVSTPAAFSLCSISLLDNTSESLGVPEQSFYPDKFIRVSLKSMVTLLKVNIYSCLFFQAESGVLLTLHNYKCIIETVGE